MGLGFRSEVHYDAGKDVTSLTSNSPDFSTPLHVSFARNSAEDIAVRALLEEQNEVDFAGLSSTTRLPSLTYVGDFGVHGDGSLSGRNITNTRHLMVVGKHGSGVENLIRSWLLWAVAEGAYVFAINQTPDLHGTAEYFSHGKVQHYATNDSSPHAFTMQETCEALLADAEEDGRPLIVLTNAVGSFLDLEASDSDFYNKLGELGGGFGANVYSLTVSDVMMDEDEDENADAGMNYWVIGDDVYTGFIGDVTVETMKYLMNDRLDIPFRNPRGVLWLSRTKDDYERINTYLIPRDIW